MQEQEQALLRRRRQRHRVELRPPRYAARQPCAQLLARAGREAAHLGGVHQHWRGGEACQQLWHEVVRRIAAPPHQTFHVRFVRRARQRLALLGLLPLLLRPLLHPQRPGYKQHGDGGDERNNLDDNVGWLLEHHLHSGLGPRLRSARRDGLVHAARSRGIGEPPRFAGREHSAVQRHDGQSLLPDERHVHAHVHVNIPSPTACDRRAPHTRTQPDPCRAHCARTKKWPRHGSSCVRWWTRCAVDASGTPAMEVSHLRCLRRRRAPGCSGSSLKSR